MSTRQVLDPRVRRDRAQRKAKRELLKRYPSPKSMAFHARLDRVSKDPRLDGYAKELRYLVIEEKWREQEGI